MTSPLSVSTEWLNERLHESNIRIVDASWHLPTSARNGKAEYQQQHIPGAVYFDIDSCTADSELPHMLPDPDRFAQYAGNLGISEHNHIIVYDSLGLFSAARVWWMFRYFGASQVSLLEGGLPAWIAAEFPLVSGESPQQAALFRAVADNAQSDLKVANADKVLHASMHADSIILDARSAARFSAIEKEFRPGLRSGHIPGSHNVPFMDLQENGFLKPDAELRRIFQRCGVEPGSSVITSCGSGVTAAVLVFALKRIGIEDIALYDGSWSEWGALASMPIEPADP
jgi:thiosulfate/3-mercaptopyruvate sulfurtransferase